MSRLSAQGVFALVLFLVVATVAALPAYPLKKSANGHYLVDQNNQPFLMIGDSPQSIIANVSTSNGDMQTYFHNRATNGINAALVMLICGDYTFGSPNLLSQNGLAPFTGTVSGGWPDLATPYLPYWTNVDFMFSVAASNGICVLANPCETGFFDYEHPVMSANGTNKLYNYGAWVGNRYKNQTNLIWHLGNDFQNWTSDSLLNASLVQGILSADTNHLITAEMQYFVSDTLEDTNLWGLATMNAAYTYYPTYAEVLVGYQRTNYVPTFMTEAHYENENVAGELGTPIELRKQFYWTMTSGACGYLYGSSNTDRMLDWNNANVLDSAGVVQMAWGVKLLTNREWYGLIPDTGSKMVISGRGTSNNTDSVSQNNYVTAAATADHTLGIVYVPMSATIGVSLTNFSGAVTSRWFDPTANTFTTITGSPFTDTINTSLTTPGTNSAGDADWVLVLESAQVVDTQPPTVTLTAPGAGAILSNTVAVSATATDNVGVLGVQFQVDGTNLGAEVSSLPYMNSWNTLTVTNGFHIVQAIAQDQAGNRATNGVSVTVSNAGSGDTQPPTVTLNAPTAGAILSNTVPVSATATDNVGVLGVQFQVDGANLGSEVPSAPFTNSWNTPNSTNGMHRVQAIARDAAGNRATNGVSVTVSNAISPPPIQPVFVGQNYATPQASQSLVVVAYPSAQTAGNANILAIGWNDTVASISAVSDSAGNVYQAAVPTYQSNGLSQAIYYSAGIKAGSNSVTVTFNQPAVAVDLRVAEYSGLSQANTFDVGASGSGSGTRATSGVVTATLTNELLFGAGMTAALFTAPGGGFTQRVITSPDGDIVEDEVAAAPGLFNATATSSSGVWLMQVAAFKPAASQSVIAPQVTACAFSNNNFVVSFNTVPGQKYELQSEANLASGSWLPVVTNISGTGGLTQATDTNALSQFQRFYRVKTGL